MCSDGIGLLIVFTFITYLYELKLKMSILSRHILSTCSSVLALSMNRSLIPKVVRGPSPCVPPTQIVPWNLLNKNKMNLFISINNLVLGALWSIKRAFQPSLLRRKRKHGYLARVKTRHGRGVLTRRRSVGKGRLCA